MFWGRSGVGNSTGFIVLTVGGCWYPCCPDYTVLSFVRNFVLDGGFNSVVLDFSLSDGLPAVCVASPFKKMYLVLQVTGE